MTMTQSTWLRRAVAACALAALVAAPCSIRHAQAADDVFTSAAKAGEDFKIQGEYAGKSPDGAHKMGVQVIALGDGKFHGVFYHGGLPGDGWKRGDEKIEADAKLENGEVKFSKEDKSAVLKDGKITLYHAGEKAAELDKVERKSSTLGAKAPSGATVLFGGKGDEKNWNGGRVNDEGYLMVGPDTKERFGDCTIHLEFRLPFMPKARGQGRGNSGVYPNSMYELQVLDSFGLSGENNECGGFYTVRQPDVNMCYPPLSWQTYDMEFTAAKYENGKKVKNARVTVKHNGVTIHDNVELPKGTPGRAAEGPGPAPLFLQDHGNPVCYRNIWIVKK